MLEAHKLHREALKANFAKGLINRHTAAVSSESRFVRSAQETRFVRSAQGSRFVRSAQETRFVGLHKKVDLSGLHKKPDLSGLHKKVDLSGLHKKEVRRAGNIQRRAIPIKCESSPRASQLQ
jgi:hypothetical protein